LRGLNQIVGFLKFDLLAETFTPNAPGIPSTPYVQNGSAPLVQGSGLGLSGSSGLASLLGILVDVLAVITVFAIVGVVVIIVVANRADPDPSGRRPQSVYFFAVSFVTLLTSVIGSTVVVAATVQLIGHHPSSIDNEVARAVVLGGLITVVSAYLLINHLGRGVAIGPGPSRGRCPSDLPVVRHRRSGRVRLIQWPSAGISLFHHRVVPRRGLLGDPLDPSRSRAPRSQVARRIHRAGWGLRRSGGAGRPVGLSLPRRQRCSIGSAVQASPVRPRPHRPPDGPTMVRGACRVTLPDTPLRGVEVRAQHRGIMRCRAPTPGTLKGPGVLTVTVRRRHDETSVRARGSSGLRPPERTARRSKRPGWTARRGFHVTPLSFHAPGRRSKRVGTGSCGESPRARQP